MSVERAAHGARSRRGRGRTPPAAIPARRRASRSPSGGGPTPREAVGIGTLLRLFAAFVLGVAAIPSALKLIGFGANADVSRSYMLVLAGVALLLLRHIEASTRSEQWRIVELFALTAIAFALEAGIYVYATVHGDKAFLMTITILAALSLGGLAFLARAGGRRSIQIAALVAVIVLGGPAAMAELSASTHRHTAHHHIATTTEPPTNQAPPPTAYSLQPSYTG